MESNSGREEEKDQLKEKPRILPLPNGSYYLINDMAPKIVENLQNSEGEPLSAIRGVVLCRCGASKNKPFCDGTHGTIGFSSENKEVDYDGKNMIKDKRKSYVGKKIAIHDNRKICSHTAECINDLSSIFKLNARSWINPEGATVEEIINTIRKCPSGALSYSIDGVEYRDQNERKPMVTVSKCGPYLVTGGIEPIGDDIQFAEGFFQKNITLYVDVVLLTTSLSVTVCIEQLTLRMTKTDYIQTYLCTAFTYYITDLVFKVKFTDASYN